MEAGSAALAVAAGLVRAVVEPLGLTLSDALRLSDVEPVPATPGQLSSTDDLAAAARLVGRRYEAALSPEARTAGSHYTPDDVAARLVGLVTGADVTGADVMGEGHRRSAPPRAWDPACGGGAFLLAVADAFLADGHDPTVILSEQVWGTDLDPGAVAVTEAALWLWGLSHGVDAVSGPHLAVADPLVDGGEDGPLGRAAVAGFDLVIGNPPFQGQMVGGNVRSARRTQALKDRWGSAVVRPYTDTAALFLVAGASALAPGGRLVMVLPTSVLAARDAAGARAAATDQADLVGLWVAAEPVFDADVDVCAPVLQRRSSNPAEPLAPPRPVERWRGRDVRSVAPSRASTGWTAEPADGRHRSWAGLALAALDVPEPVVRTAGRLGSLVRARAGFRDEYYGLVGSVVESPLVAGGDEGPSGAPSGFAPLVTSGLIDPGRCRWGERPVRFARTRFERPVVDLDRLADAGGRAQAWVQDTLVPKVVVATQTRVGEAAVDLEGRWVASTPTVALVAEPELLWRIAAVVCSPVGSVAAFATSAGSARAAAALRQGASTLVELPLPIDGDAWAAGAEALRLGDRSRFLDAMAVAYDVDEPGPLHDWWAGRAPWPA